MSLVHLLFGFSLILLLLAGRGIWIERQWRKERSRREKQFLEQRKYIMGQERKP